MPPASCRIRGELLNAQLPTRLMSAIEQKAALPAAGGQLVGGAGALGVAITEKVHVGNRSQITDEALVSNLNLQAFY
ncbi:hypothetical protein SLE2022_320940 [Rubroshorea leprosula]